MKFAWLTLLFFFTASLAIAQTCCTGGVPHLAGLRIPLVNEKQFGTSLSYIYNKNGDLILNNNSIETSSVYRNVNSILFQGDYGLTDKVSFSFILPYIVQSEVIDFDNSKQTYENSGIGDVSIWSNYKSDISSKLFLTASMGIKFPTGATDKREEGSNIPLPFSFQNGTGSIDFGFISFAKYSIDRQKLYNIIAQIALKVNTRGNNFEAHPNYLFGHTGQFSLLFNRPFVDRK